MYIYIFSTCKQHYCRRGWETTKNHNAYIHTCTTMIPAQVRYTHAFPLQRFLGARSRPFFVFSTGVLHARRFYYHTLMPPSLQQCFTCTTIVQIHQHERLLLRANNTCSGSEYKIEKTCSSYMQQSIHAMTKITDPNSHTWDTCWLYNIFYTHTCLFRHCYHNNTSLINTNLS